MPGGTHTHKRNHEDHDDRSKRFPLSRGIIKDFHHLLEEVSFLSEGKRTVSFGFFRLTSYLFPKIKIRLVINTYRVLPPMKILRSTSDV